MCNFRRAQADKKFFRKYFHNEHGRLELAECLLPHVLNKEETV